MLWRLEVAGEGEEVVEHEGVTFVKRDFFIPSEPEDQTVPGFTAYDEEGEAIEMIGGHGLAVEGKKEALLCINGLWVQSGASWIGAGAEGLYYGAPAEGGGFVEVPALEAANDPRVQRQWNLSPLLEGAGYGGSDPD